MAVTFWGVSVLEKLVMWITVFLEVLGLGGGRDPPSLCELRANKVFCPLY